MEQKKYEFTGETRTIAGGITLRRIKALRDVGRVKAGTLGGWIEKEDNLSHEGDCWVYGEIKEENPENVRYGEVLYDPSEVYGNAEVRGNAKVYESKVYGNARILDSAELYKSEVGLNAVVSGYIHVGRNHIRTANINVLH